MNHYGYNENKEMLSKRLNRIEGQIRGVSKMVQDDKYCIDVIKQIEAVQAALRKTQEIMLDTHLHTCVTTAIRGDDAGRREAVIDEILDVFAVTKK